MQAGSKGSLYLCVDAGGTKTIAVIANCSERVIAKGHAGPANMAELGTEIAAMEVERAVRAALSELQEAPEALIQATCGMSGCDSPVDAELMTARLRRSIPCITVFNDAMLLASPLTRHPQTCWAVAVIAGTGSIVFGLTNWDPTTPPAEHSTSVPSPPHASGPSIVFKLPNTSDKRRRARPARSFAKRGGHGFLFGDKGSGYHLGLTAIEMAADDFDAGDEQARGLASAMRQYYDVPHTSELPSKAHDLPLNERDPIRASNDRKLKIAQLAPIVLDHVRQKDGLAVRALSRSVGALAQDIAVIVEKAGRIGLSVGDRGGLVVSGGLGVQELFMDTLRACLAERGIEFDWVEKVSDAAGDGAVALAVAHQ